MKHKKDSEKSLYRQVETYIKKYIVENDLKAGDMLPTETELETLLKVSRTTIRSALIELQYNGYVIKQQGRGTFVAKTSYEQQLPLLTSFTEDAHARDGITSSLVLGKDIILPDEALALKLQISKKDQVFKLFRLRMVGGEPLMITTSYMPMKEIKNMNIDEIDFTTISLYKSLEDAGVVLNSGEERASVDRANSNDAMFLKIEEGAPIFVTKRIIFDENKNVIEHSVSRTRGDRHKTLVKLER